MNANSSLTSHESNLLIAWSVLLTLVFIALGTFAGMTTNQYRLDSVARRNARIDPQLTEFGKPAAATSLPPGAKPRKVTVGVYIDRISSVDILESNWHPVFYIWFKWQGDDIHPGETFQVVDGEVTEKKKISESLINGEHYAMYFVRAQVTKFFTTFRFPVDDHLMTLAIEDEKRYWTELEYIPDSENSSVNHRVKIPGYKIHKAGLVIKPHTYDSNFGNSIVKERHSIYSQAIFWIWYVRPGLGPYFKIFVGLFAAILISMLPFFIKPTDVDPRFGLGVGAFFGAVANMLLAASLVPDNGYLTLMDIINGIGIITIFLTLIQSTISLYIYDIQGRTKFSRMFDLVSLVIFTLGSVIINIMVPLLGIVRLT